MDLHSAPGVHPGNCGSSSVYLSLLAAGDLAVVVIGLVPEWLGQIGAVEIWNLGPWWCRVELYLYYTSLDFAIWMLVAFTCDRLIAVRFPLQKRHLSTPRRAVVVSGCILLLANLNAHVFWTRGTVYVNGSLLGHCKYLSRYFYFEATVRPWLVLVLALLGPLLVIAVCNVVILSTVRTARAMRSQSARGSMRNEYTSRRMRTHYGQTTVMCLIACSAFMLLVLPSIILLIGKNYWKTSSGFWLARAVASQLVFINHSINFILYSLSGTRFRRELDTICHKKQDRDVMELSSSTRSTRITMAPAAGQHRASYSRSYSLRPNQHQMIFG